MRIFFRRGIARVIDVTSMKTTSSSALSLTLPHRFADAGLCSPQLPVALPFASILKCTRHSPLE